jgi:hypothetical protein
VVRRTNDPNFDIHVRFFAPRMLLAFAAWGATSCHQKTALQRLLA